MLNLKSMRAESLLECAKSEVRKLVVPLMRLGLLDFPSLDVLLMHFDFEVSRHQPPKSPLRVALNIDTIMEALRKVTPASSCFIMNIQSQLMSIHSQLWEMVVLDKMLCRECVSVQPEVVTPELDAVAPPEEVAIRDDCWF